MTGSSDKLDASTLRQAERLHGVCFPSDSRERLVALIEGQLAGVRAIRALEMPREAQPAFRFDPRMPGRTYPQQTNTLRLGDESLERAPLADDDLAYASVTELSTWLKSRQVTSTRLTELYLRRIERLNSRLHAYITVTADVARKEARACDAELDGGRWRGPLHGIPYGLKDVFDTAGIPSTYGSFLFKDRVPAADAAIVKMLRDAGAVLLGKQATAELAHGATWFGGMVRNPWNPEEPAGGSSAGAGAAVAAGLCAFAIGTDSLGSILNPADRCGVVGLRPTFGRIPVQGAMPLTPTLERIGPLCRRIEDAALVLAAINGPDRTSINSLDVGFSYDARIDLGKIKVGYSPRWFESIGFGAPDNVPADVSYLDVLEAMRSLGVKMVEVDLPDLPYLALLPIVYVESAAVFEDLALGGADAQLLCPWPDLWRQARLYSAVDYLQAERFRRQVMTVMDDLLRQTDVLFAPTYGNFELLVIANFVGLPGLSFRCGFRQTPTRGLGSAPIDAAGTPHRVTTNVSLHGRLFEEGKMLALARAVERNLGVWRERPPID